MSRNTRKQTAPYIFNAVADMVEWILLNRYNVTDLMHYPDDFITAGPANSERCMNNLQTSWQFVGLSGLPFTPANVLAPSTHMVILGVELDSLQQSVYLPMDKLAALQELIQLWRHKQWCTRCQLESVIGHLHHATK